MRIVKDKTAAGGVKFLSRDDPTAERIDRIEKELPATAKEIRRLLRYIFVYAGQMSSF